ncbi:MAG: hypothetical protein QM676_14695 [Novosphingobium sp.]
MSGERITTHEVPGHTTVIYEGPPRSSGLAGWFFGLVALIAILAAVYLLAVRDTGPSAKNNAIAEAANKVDTAAEQIGDAAQDAAKNVKPAN